MAPNTNLSPLIKKQLKTSRASVMMTFNGVNRRLLVSIFAIYSVNISKNGGRTDAFTMTPSSLQRHISTIPILHMEPNPPLTSTHRRKKTKNKINRNLKRSTNLKKTKLLYSVNSMNTQQKEKETTDNKILRQESPMQSNQKRSKFLEKSMMNHRILNKKEEKVLSEQIVKARKLRATLSEFSANKKLHEMENDTMEGNIKNEIAADIITNQNIEHLNYDYDYDWLFQNENENENNNHIIDNDIQQQYNDFFSIFSDPLLGEEINSLDEGDITNELQIAGGKKEVLQILMDGVTAKQTLVSCNIKLVTSIARSWMRRTILSFNGNSGRTNLEIMQIYEVGAWGIPSLDEAIHEGILGLMKAADKFEAKRGNKFSTYATHWITSYIRECFRTSSTGCLRIPAALHQVKASHAKIIKECSDLDIPQPTEDEIAKEIGVNVNRLRTALKFTQPLVSIDSAVHMSRQTKKGSSAGGDNSDNELLISDTLKW